MLLARKNCAWIWTFWLGDGCCVPGCGWVFIGYEGRVHWTKRAQGELELAGSSAPSTLGVRPYCLLLSGGAGEDGAGPPGPVGTWLVCGLLAVLRVSDGFVNLWAHLAVTWVRLTL